MLFFGVVRKHVKSPVGMWTSVCSAGPELVFYPRQTLMPKRIRSSAERLRSIESCLKSEQLLTVDLLARASMKNAANCDK
jgi:hypothetical protein